MFCKLACNLEIQKAKSLISSTLSLNIIKLPCQVLARQSVQIGIHPLGNDWFKACK